MAARNQIDYAAVEAVAAVVYVAAAGDGGGDDDVPAADHAIGSVSDAAGFVDYAAVEAVVDASAVEYPSGC